METVQKRRLGGKRVSRRDAATTKSCQEMRTAVTRKALLDAALHVFVRDGFEASRIEDIAAEAGRSRGAFYLNFSSKAEVFLALRAHQFAAWEEPFCRQLAEQTTREKLARTVEEYMTGTVLEKSYALLELEFKLFAIRHPRMLSKLAQQHVEAECEIEELRSLYPEGKRGNQVLQQQMLALESILEGFALNFAFHPEVLTPRFLSKCVPQLARLVVEMEG